MKACYTVTPKEILKHSIGQTLYLPVGFALWENCKQPCNAIKSPYFTIQSVEVEKRLIGVKKRVDALALLSSDVETIELAFEFKFASPKRNLTYCILIWKVYRWLK